ncbi:hypothetical protein BHQ15_17385 [Mycolicibacillus koreensis]|nr:hypothetical protein BHQ15_17385 [Mycolicibacillus koreensis]
MFTADRLRTAVAERDLEQLAALFAEDARLFSPMKFAPIVGRRPIVTLLGVLLTRVFEDFRYVGELTGPCETAAAEETVAHAMVFRATVDDRQVQGVDLIYPNESGLIEEFTIMLRPRSALELVLKRVNEGLAALGALPAQ